VHGIAVQFLDWQFILLRGQFMQTQQQKDEQLQKRIVDALTVAKDFLERCEYGEVIIKRLCDHKVDVITTRRKRCD